MDVLLQRHCAKYIYVVPDGLRELMSDISREVLRTQPNEIYTFIADYLDALLITRENARVAAKLVESITEIAVTIASFLTTTGMSREEADRVTTIIQTAFRKHLKAKAEKEHEAVEEANIVTEILEAAALPSEQAERAAIIIQQAYRNFRERRERERELLMGMIDWRIAARSAIYLYRKTGVTPEEANRAATLIKAAYKGYYTRRIMRRLLEESQRRYAEEEGEEIEGEGYPYPDRWGEGLYAEDETESMKERFVRIDYDTVKPRVDFDHEAHAAEEAEGKDEHVLDSATVVSTIMDSLLSSVFPTEVEQMRELPPVEESAPTTDTEIPKQGSGQFVMAAPTEPTDTEPATYHSEPGRIPSTIPEEPTTESAPETPTTEASEIPETPDETTRTETTEASEPTTETSEPTSEAPQEPTELPPETAEMPAEPTEAPPEAGEHPPEAGEHPPDASEQPPEKIEPPPQTVEPPPETVEAPPEIVEPPAEVVEAPAEVVEPPPEPVEEPPAEAAEPPPPIVEEPPPE